MKFKKNNVWQMSPCCNIVKTFLTRFHNITINNEILINLFNIYLILSNLTIELRLHIAIYMSLRIEIEVKEFSFDQGIM